LATATQIAEYELVLMLDPEAPDERRDQIADEARQRITSGG
jgi:ribosomal protein S6